MRPVVRPARPADAGAVFTDNLRARRFYAHHGFEPDGTEQLDEDAGLLELRMVRGSQ